MPRHRISFELARLAFADPRAIDRLDLDEADEDRILLSELASHVLRGERSPHSHYLGPNVSKTTTATKPREKRAVRSGPNGKRDQHNMTAADWAALRAMTQAEVLAAARRAPDALPVEDRPPGSVRPARRVSFASTVGSPTRPPRPALRSLPATRGPSSQHCRRPTGADDDVAPPISGRPARWAHTATAGGWYVLDTAGDLIQSQWTYMCRKTGSAPLASTLGREI